MSDVGLTAEELKRQYDEKNLKEALTFRTNGISQQAALDYLETPEGQLYRRRLIEANPDTSLLEIRRRAIDQITSGQELPRMEMLDGPLVKIVPKGQRPSPFSPYWAKEADLDAAIRQGRNLSHHFALPVASESPRYDVYRITPKAPTEAFVNTVGAYGAEKLYEDSRLQQWSRALGGEVGQLGYDHVSREGRLLRQVNALKEDLQHTTDPTERARMQTRLDSASAAYCQEARRNGRYFEGRTAIDQNWEAMHTRFPRGRVAAQGCADAGHCPERRWTRSAHPRAARSRNGLTRLRTRPRNAPVPSR